MSGWLHILKYLDEAASRGSLQVDECLDRYRSDQPFLYRALQLATTRGHIQVVRFLYSKRKSDWCVDKELLEATAKGHLKVVCFLLTVEPPRHAILDEVLQIACEEAHVAIVQWMLQEELECGYVQTLNYLLTAPHRFPDDAAFQYTTIEQLLKQHINSRAPRRRFLELH